jgi:hypothetical protein
VWEKSLVAERRLKEAKKRQLNLATNSQQAQPSRSDEEGANFAMTRRKALGLFVSATHSALLPCQSRFLLFSFFDRRIVTSRRLCKN